MANLIRLDTTIYKETLELVQGCRSKNALWRSFERSLLAGKKTYLGRPFAAYALVLACINRNYQTNLNELVKNPNPKNFMELIEEFVKNERDVKKFEQEQEKIDRGETQKPDFIPDELHEKFIELDQMQEGAEKVEAFEDLVQTHLEPPPITPPEITPIQFPHPTPQIPKTEGEVELNKPPVSYSQANLPPAVTTPPGQMHIEGVANKSQTQTRQPLTTKRLFTKLPKIHLPTSMSTNIQKLTRRYATPKVIASAATSLIGGVVGFGVGGNTGALFGAVVGASTPTIVSQPGFGNFAGSVAKTGINASGNFLSGLSSRRAAIGRGTSSFKALAKKGASRWLILVLLFMFPLIFIVGFTPGVSTPGTSGTPPTTGGGTTGRIPVGGVSSIGGCKFTRAGTAYDIRSTVLQGWITQAANSAGISPAVLASVVMHESPDFVANATDEHDGIRTNQYCVKGKIFCEKSGRVLHSKANQGQDDPCTPEEIAGGARNAQAVGLGQNLDIYNPGRDLCSITESLALSADKLKKSGMTTNPDQAQVNKAINSYFNSCTYGRYSYCDEVWKDVQNCQASPTPPVSQDLASILDWNSRINNALTLGTFYRGHYSTLLQNITNGSYQSGTWAGNSYGSVYWCTYSIIDSYNLAGVSGLSKASHAAVVNMRQWWKTHGVTSGYQYIDGGSVNGVKPGFAIFMERVAGTHTSNEHVALIKSVQLNSVGDGRLETYDSNSTAKTHIYPIVSYNVKNTPYPVRGFGGI